MSRVRVPPLALGTNLTDSFRLLIVWCRNKARLAALAVRVYSDRGEEIRGCITYGRRAKPRSHDLSSKIIQTERVGDAMKSG